MPPKRISDAGEAVFTNQDKGADFLIAQAWEAGGHVKGTVAMSVLIPAIADKVNIPIVATGGIADGRGFMAALGLGASGICLGTRFLMYIVAGLDPVYQQLIKNASENDTYYAEKLFNIGWDDAPHRVLNNSTVVGWLSAGKPDAGQRPGEDEIIAYYPDGRPIPRYADMGPMRNITGNLEAMALYAGQSAGLISNVKSAAGIIEALVKELYDTMSSVNKML